MKKFFLTLILAAFCGMSSAFAYDFSAVCPTGQTLYYNIIYSQTGHEVELTCPKPEIYGGFWEGYSKPYGHDIALPSTVEQNGICYTVTKISSYAFYKCHGLMGNLVIPNTVTSIGYQAFYDCTGLDGELIIPNSVIHIDTKAFEDCSNLIGGLNIPESVVSIGSKAFHNCSGFTGNLIIPKSVASIGKYAFYDCVNFESIITDCQIPPTTDSTAFHGIPTTIPVHIPPCSLPLYQVASGWSQFENFLPESFYQLTVTSENEAFGSVTIIQQPDCETDAIVEATADEGCSFKGWSVNGEIISTENPFTFAVTEDTELVAIFSGLGVDDNEMTTASVYPNPTTGLFIIEGQDITEVEVYNAQGQLIRTQMISGDRTEIDLSNAANGLYLVRIMSGAGVTERTVVKR